MIWVAKSSHDYFQWTYPIVYEFTLLFPLYRQLSQYSLLDPTDLMILLLAATLQIDLVTSFAWLSEKAFSVIPF